MKFAIKRLLSIALSLGILVLVMAFGPNNPDAVNKSIAFNRGRPSASMTTTAPTRR
jgi:hypothetical protein